MYFEADEQTFLRDGELAQRGQQPAGASAVRVGLANEAGFPHLGSVDFVDNQVDPRTGTIRARAVVSNADRAFTPGLFARVQMEGGQRVKAMLIDEKAVLTDQDRKYVYVLGPKNVAVRKDISLGSKVGGLRVVEHGLADRGPRDRARRAEGVLRRHAGRAADHRRWATRRCPPGCASPSRRRTRHCDAAEHRTDSSGS